MSNTTWVYVVEFSCMVEKLKSFDPASILSCEFHPKVIGDALVRLAIPVEELDLSKIPFKTYSNDRTQSDESFGGVRLYKVTDVSSFVGQNDLVRIRNEYNV